MLLTALRDPQVIEIYGCGDLGGLPYLVLKLASGGTLKDFLSYNGPLMVGDAVAIALQACRAIAVCHRQGIIHCDVKPQNFLLDHRSGIMIADFGIARRLGEGPIAVGQRAVVEGTPDYLSPEQASGAVLTPATDVYALGAILYELLIGVPPFYGTSPIAIAIQHMAALVPALRALRPEVPRWLERVVRRALAEDPAARYPTAAALGEALVWAPVETEHLLPWRGG